jgi:chitinase
MASRYDFAGSWDQVAGHQANLFTESATAFSVTGAVKHYRKFVASDKLIIGIPLYGRSFLNTDGPGTPFQGVGQGSWEAGNYDYKALPLPESTTHHDMKLGASWCYRSSNREMVSYDTVQIAQHKAQWIRSEKRELMLSALIERLLIVASWGSHVLGDEWRLPLRPP